MRWIYLSPHFDDAALSCGGLIWEQVQAGLPVEVWTICAAAPPANVPPSDYAARMHTRWQLIPSEVVAARMKEDQAAMQVLGVPSKYFELPDAIYRRHPKTGEYLYTSDGDLFGGINPGDRDTFQQLVIRLAGALSGGEVSLVAPLTVGNHIDHQLVRVAAEALPLAVKYYPDYPYTRNFPDSIQELVPEDWAGRAYPLSAAGLAAWQDSAAAYASQINTFWQDELDMRQQIAVHSESFGGVTLFELID